MTGPRSTRKAPRSAAGNRGAGPRPPSPVRLTRVRTALQRIASGYYERDDVRDRLVTLVLKELRRG